MGKGLIQLASTGLFVWAVIWWATRKTRRAARVNKADLARRVLALEEVAVHQDERLTQLEQSAGYLGGGQVFDAPRPPRALHG